jgi:hypothetical protein
LSSVLLTPQESSVLETTLSGFIFNADVKLVSQESLDRRNENGLGVNFTAKVILDQVGFSGVYLDEISRFDNAVSLVKDTDPNLILSQLHHSAGNSVALCEGALAHLTVVTMSHLEVSSMSYQVGGSGDVYPVITNPSWQSRDEEYTTPSGSGRLSSGRLSVVSVASFLAVLLLTGVVVVGVGVRGRVEQREYSRSPSDALLHSTHSHDAMDDTTTSRVDSRHGLVKGGLSNQRGVTFSKQ